MGSRRSVRRGDAAAAVALAALLACLALPASGQAAFPGANGKISYEGQGVSSVADTSVFSMNPDGTSKANLTATLASAPLRRGTATGSYEPSYSADGRKIVFEHVAQGTFRQDIWVMNADGSARNNVTNSVGVREEDPALSPDGSKIVFVREPESSDLSLYVMNSDGTSQTDLTGTLNLSFEANPEFSPDGSKIAFSASVGTDQDIYVINTNGTGLSNLTSSLPNPSYRPSWSPDGNAIAFQVTGATRTDSDIYVIGADGGSITALTAGVSGAEVDSPAYSPDGTLIAYARDDGADGNSDIFTMSATSGLQQTDITAESTADENDPSWGPVPTQPDEDPPQTTIDKQPASETGKSTAKLKFTSSEAGSTFECSLKGKGVDQGLKKYRPCDSGKVKYKDLEDGKKKFRVRAIDAAGNVDPTPAKAKWKVL
jgi:Tol biopolymer transport system component